MSEQTDRSGREPEPEPPAYEAPRAEDLASDEPLAAMPLVVSGS